MTKQYIDGKELKKIRESIPLTQREAAILLNLNKLTISKMENAHVKCNKIYWDLLKAYEGGL